MKCLTLPSASAEIVFDACCASVTSQEVTDRLVAGRSRILAQAGDYLAAAQLHELHTLQACRRGNNNQIVAVPLTKGDLVELYSTHMVGKTNAGRTYYDRLIVSAAKCPYCGLGHTSTLDHFLTKSRYPAFSVLPINLVPSCKDCNHGRKSRPLAVNEAHLHPYFESADIETTPWLYAAIEQTSPATAVFHVAPSGNWSAELQRRVENHFREFQLAKRYAVEAAGELASKSDFLRELPSDQVRGEHLATSARAERSYRTNTWKAALYEAMSMSDWYWQEGYLLRG